MGMKINYNKDFGNESKRLLEKEISFPSRRQVFSCAWAELSTNVSRCKYL